ncbi:MAG TPA: hypothetical protein DIW17_04270 [Clostridiales bacterium]|nr:DUF1659 domain-containing protein [Clostridia bacterium]HCS73073.1 hypothetical protein [Clostridiales bacterium]
MALENRPYSTRVQIQFDLGTDENEKKLTASKSLSNIKTNSSDQDIYDVAIGLADLQTYPVNYVRKVSQADLVDVV